MWTPTRRRGYTVNQVGASYAVDLAAFTLRGSRFVRLRNKISRATRSGLVVHRGAARRTGPPSMAALDAEWLRGKGKHAKPLEFLVGEYGGPVQHARRLFAGTIDGELAGYISYSPAYGSRPGWLHDLSRRRPTGPPGVMEAINAAAIEAFRAEGVPWLHFGFTPFTGLSADLEHPSRERLVPPARRPAVPPRRGRVPGGHPARLQAQVGAARGARASTSPSPTARA